MIDQLVAIFLPLGFLPGPDNFSQALSISKNGQYVVGHSSSDNCLNNDWLPYLDPSYEGFVYDVLNQTMVGLGDLPDGDNIYFNSVGLSVSNNGTVVGKSVSEDSSKGIFWSWEGFKWTVEDGMVPIGVIDNGWLNYSVANKISANGMVIVGQINNGGKYQGFTIDPNNGMIILPNIDDTPFGKLVSTTRNGLVSVGSDMIKISDQKRSEPRAILYDHNTQTIHIPFNSYSVFSTISNNGRYIAGYTKHNNMPVNFIYDALTNTTNVLYHIPFFIPNDISDDGVIVGQIDIGHSVVYYAGCYFKDNDLVIFAEHQGWEITSITGISSNGVHWCGYGINPDGIIESWYIQTTE